MPPVPRPPHQAACSTVNESPATIEADGATHKVLAVRHTGNVILDVTFENTPACNKSIPSDALQKLRAAKQPIKSTRIFYRVQLDTLTRHSKYFAHLLGSEVFGEGREVSAKLAEIVASKKDPSELETSELPRIRIVDEDDATRTLGRESVFRDLLQILHGAEHLSQNISLTYLSILVIMADRFDSMSLVARYINTGFRKFRYPVTLERSHEEALRQKILVFYHTNQAIPLAGATKELILRGSQRWNTSGEEDKAVYTTLWWDLPEGLEAELAYRRVRILCTIASLQTHFLNLYTSRSRQCTLGYDSSPGCDSFQLGEMIKFLVKKDLLSLVPFQSVSLDDPGRTWPEAFNGAIEHLISTLRQCPSYQIDENHTHCGLRSQLIPPLDYVRDCVEQGVGIKIQRWKTDRASSTWQPQESSKGGIRKNFVVDEAAEERRAFDFSRVPKSAMELAACSMSSDAAAKALFTAETYQWGGAAEEPLVVNHMARDSSSKF